MMTILNLEQYDFCNECANELAKIMLEKKITPIFPDENNALFCLETTLIFTAGILAVLANKINIDELKLLETFSAKAKEVMRSYKKPKLELIN